MKKLWAKIKQIKHWEIYATVIVVVIMLGIYLSGMGSKKNTNDGGVVTTVTTVDNSYAGQMEQKLEEVLGCVAGAGRVAVMVMTDGEGTAELAYDVQEKTVEQAGANGQTVTTTTIDKTVVVKNGSPLVLWNNPPKLLGIVVVATGASDPAVRLNLLHAVQTLIGEQSVEIQILSGI